LKALREKNQMTGKDKSIKKSYFSTESRKKERHGMRYFEHKEKPL
jgi:hypothetical protein